MTTAFSHAVRLELLSSARAQPLGMLLALLTPIVMFGALHAALTGVRLDRMIEPLLRLRTMWIGAVLLGGAWLYKLIEAS